MSRWTVRRILYILPLMDELTDRQHEILKLVRELHRSVRLSADAPSPAHGFRSVNAAEQHLRALEKKAQSRSPRAPRAASACSTAARATDRAAARAAGRWPRRRRQPHAGRGACPGTLSGRSQPVHAARRLPAARARHVDARCRHPGRRPARGASHARSAHRPDRRRAACRRGHRQALSPRAHGGARGRESRLQADRGRPATRPLTIEGVAVGVSATARPSEKS